MGSQGSDFLFIGAHVSQSFLRLRNHSQKLGYLQRVLWFLMASAYVRDGTLSSVVVIELVKTTL